MRPRPIIQVCCLNMPYMYLIGVPHPELFKPHAAPADVGFHRQMVFAVGLGAALAAEDEAPDSLSLAPTLQAAVVRARPLRGRQRFHLESVKRRRKGEQEVESQKSRKDE